MKIKNKIKKIKVILSRLFTYAKENYYRFFNLSNIDIGICLKDPVSVRLSQKKSNYLV